MFQVVFLLLNFYGVGDLVQSHLQKSVRIVNPYPFYGGFYNPMNFPGYGFFMNTHPVMWKSNENHNKNKILISTREVAFDPLQGGTLQSKGSAAPVSTDVRPPQQPVQQNSDQLAVSSQQGLNLQSQGQSPSRLPAGNGGQIQNAAQTSGVVQALPGQPIPGQGPTNDQSLTRTGTSAPLASSAEALGSKKSDKGSSPPLALRNKILSDGNSISTTSAPPALMHEPTPLKMLARPNFNDKLELECRVLGDTCEKCLTSNKCSFCEESRSCHSFWRAIGSIDNHMYCGTKSMNMFSCKVKIRLLYIAMVVSVYVISLSIAALIVACVIVKRKNSGQYRSLKENLLPPDVVSQSSSDIIKPRITPEGVRRKTLDEFAQDFDKSYRTRYD